MLDELNKFFSIPTIGTPNALGKGACTHFQNSSRQT